MDPIKEAFTRVKEDMSLLKAQLDSLHNQIEELKRTLSLIPTYQQAIQQTDRQVLSTETLLNSNTDASIPTHDSQKQPLEALKRPNSHISTGNRGVPTDRQTDQQTDRHNPIQELNEPLPLSSQFKEKKEQFEIHPISKISKAAQILDSLDDIKKEIRYQFKKLTHQEMLIFSTIYQLEDQGLTVDYPLIASKLNLSESSIRDYVLKITRKGVPIEKSKENNKKVVLTIHPDLRKIASLQTILTLREI